MHESVGLMEFVVFVVRDWCKAKEILSNHGKMHKALYGRIKNELQLNIMEIGPSGLHFSLWSYEWLTKSDDRDLQYWTTQTQVPFPINHNRSQFPKKNQIHLGQTIAVETMSKEKSFSSIGNSFLFFFFFRISSCCHSYRDQYCDYRCPITANCPITTR